MAESTSIDEEADRTSREIIWIAFFEILKYSILSNYPLISGHRWCKKNCLLIGGVRLLESFSISVLISRMKHFSVSTRCSWVVGLISG